MEGGDWSRFPGQGWGLMRDHLEDPTLAAGPPWPPAHPGVHVLTEAGQGRARGQGRPQPDPGVHRPHVSEDIRLRVKTLSVEARTPPWSPPSGTGVPDAAEATLCRRTDTQMPRGTHSDPGKDPSLRGPTHWGPGWLGHLSSGKWDHVCQACLEGGSGGGRVLGRGPQGKLVDPCLPRGRLHHSLPTSPGPDASWR